MRERRRIVQITAGSGDERLFAMCDDGTLWALYGDTNAWRWHEVTEVSQRPSRNDQVPISWMPGLPVRFINRLEDAGITLVQDLEFRLTSLDRMNGIGPKGAKVIQAAFAAFAKAHPDRKWSYHGNITP